MAFNPMALMKLMSAKNKFTSNHPKFVAFATAMLKSGVQEGTIIEVTVTKPGAEPVTSNMKVNADDIELFNELKEMGNNYQQ